MTQIYLRAQSKPLAATLTDIYTVPTFTSTICNTIVVCNQAGAPTSFRISVAPLGAADATSQYLFYDVAIAANATEFVGFDISLLTSDIVRVYATLATVSFSLFGIEYS